MSHYQRTIQYEEFLPHWGEFADALEQYQYCLKCLPADDGIKSILQLRDVELPDNVLDLLSSALKSTHFHQLTLQSNNFGQRGIDFAFKYVKTNPVLKDFCFNDNPVENMKDINRLCQSENILPLRN